MTENKSEKGRDKKKPDNEIPNIRPEGECKLTRREGRYRGREQGRVAGKINRKKKRRQFTIERRGTKDLGN